MSRGLTRRVARMIPSGVMSGELLRAADHEADLLAHPYIGIEHVELARLRLVGLNAERDVLRQSVSSGVRRRWWRPLGYRSALRRRGLEHTRAAQQLAKARERGSGVDS